MKREVFSRAARGMALVAGVGFVVASGCLNPRPEELPSSVDVEDTDPAGSSGSGGSASVPLGPPADGSAGSAASPDSSNSTGEDAGSGELDGGLLDADTAADAGAPTE